MAKYVFQLDTSTGLHLWFHAIELPTLGALAATGFSISPTTGVIVGTAFTAPPITDAGEFFHAYIGVPTSLPGVWPPTWSFGSRWVPRIPDNMPPTSGRGTNDQGDLVGWWKNANEEIHPYVWRSGAPAPIPFDIPGAFFKNDSTIHNAVLDINNDGIVVGQYAKVDMAAPNFHHTGFVADAYAPQGPADFVEVDVHMLEATAVVVRGINDLRDVVGRYDHKVLNASKQMVNKTSGFASTDAAGGYANCQSVDVPGADSTIVSGINHFRQIVGYYMVGTQRHGFIWAVDGSGTPVGPQPTTVDYPGATLTRLDHIDDSGLMIGTTGPDGSFMPFVCRYIYTGLAESLSALGHLALVQLVSAGVAGGGRGWVTPYLGWPHPVPPPLPYREFGQEAITALALRDLAGSLGPGQTRDTIQKVLRDYAVQQLHSIK